MLTYKAIEGSHTHKKKKKGKNSISFLKLIFTPESSISHPMPQKAIFNVMGESCLLPWEAGWRLYAALLEMQQELLMGILMQIICLKISCAPHHSFIQPVISLNEWNSRLWRFGLGMGVFWGFFFWKAPLYILALRYHDCPVSNLWLTGDWCRIYIGK